MSEKIISPFHFLNFAGPSESGLSPTVATSHLENAKLCATLNCDNHTEGNVSESVEKTVDTTGKMRQ